MRSIIEIMGIPMGIMMAKVPHEVPVENAMMLAARKRRAGIT